MRKFVSRPLLWHFITKSLFVSILVLIATLIALAQLTVSYFAQNKLTRIVEVARAIDNIAIVTAQPDHIHQFVDSSIPADENISIRVIDRNSGRILATNAPNEYRKTLAETADAEVVKVAKQAILSGQFHAKMRTDSGRQFSVLPLSAARHALAGNFVLDLATQIKPAWHMELKVHSKGNIFWLAPFLDKSPYRTNATFTLPASKYSGLILIENKEHWTSSLASSAFLGGAVIIATGFALIILSGWYVTQAYILRPVYGLSKVLKAQRTGYNDARARRSPVREFDQFARQWNGLLNYRQAAEERQRVLSKVLEHAPIGIEVTDPNALVEYANPAYLQMTGYSLLDVLGKSPRQLIRSKQADAELLDECEQELRAGRDWQGEYPSAKKDGTEFISEVSLHPILSETGELERVVAVRQDITERKRYEQSLIAAKQASEEAEQAKSEFIARMSHELRTPFNSIIGFADMIAKQQLGPVGNKDYIEFASIIERSARGLLAIINSIIDLSKLAAGERALDDAPVNPILIAERVVRSFGQTDTQDPPVIAIHDRLKGYGLCADEPLLEHMLSNLISNAIKFSKPEGEVQIIFKKDRQRRIVCEVKDNGIGIERDQQTAVFRPFVQLAHSHVREHDGLGLGLTLAENQAAAHGAEISLTSKKGHGTTVKVVFPKHRTIRPQKADNPHARRLPKYSAASKAA